MYFLLFTLALGDPGLQFKQAIQLTKEKRFEESESILKQLDARRIDRESYHYYRLVNNFSLNKRKESQTHAEELGGFDVYRLPIRHQALVFIMTRELKKWKKDDLADISRDMGNVQNRLGQYKSGKVTQKAQKDIVNRLDKLIKKLEDTKNKKEQKEQKEQEQKQKQEQEQEQKQRQEESKQAQPKKDSTMEDDKAHLGSIDQKIIQKYTPIWGKLPPREREAIMRDITKELPPRYKEIIMEYFKRLSQDR